MIIEAVPLVMRTIRTEANRRVPLDVSLPQLRALACLQNHAGISLCLLAEQLGLLPSSASKVVDQLVTRGLVTRQDDPADRRRAILTMTADGQTTLYSARQAILPYLAERFSALSASERSVLTDAMRLLQKLFAPDRNAPSDSFSETETK